MSSMTAPREGASGESRPGPASGEGEDRVVTSVPVPPARRGSTSGTVGHGDARAHLLLLGGGLLGRGFLAGLLLLASRLFLASHPLLLSRSAVRDPPYGHLALLVDRELRRRP